MREVYVDGRRIKTVHAKSGRKKLKLTIDRTCHATTSVQIASQGVEA